MADELFTRSEKYPKYGTGLNEYRPNVMRSEVYTHDRGQDSPIQTDYGRLRCLLYSKQEKLNSFNLAGLYQLTISLQTATS